MSTNKKYYAIVRGGKKGIFESWEECKRFTTGVEGAIFKSFKSEEEAKSYLVEKERELEAEGKQIEYNKKGEQNMEEKQERERKDKEEEIEEKEERIREKEENNELCRECNKEVGKNSKAIQCERCKRWFDAHRRCGGNELEEVL